LCHFKIILKDQKDQKDQREKFDYLLRLPLCSWQRWISFNGYQLARDGKQKEFYNIGGISGSLSLSIRHEAACTSGREASFRTFGGDISDGQKVTTLREPTSRSPFFHLH